jgi:hypothetical protein
MSRQDAKGAKKMREPSRHNGLERIVLSDLGDLGALAVMTE